MRKHTISPTSFSAPEKDKISEKLQSGANDVSTPNSVCNSGIAP
jgi:hypothetical protein